MNRPRLFIMLLIAGTLSFTLMPGRLHASEEVIKKGEMLTLRRCLDIALTRQPNIIAAMNTVDAARSRIGQARAGYYPQIGLSGDYSRIKPSSVSGGRASGGNFRASGSESSFDQYTSSATLSQLIYDFGKTSTQVKIQNLNLDSSSSDLENTTLQIFFNVKQSYYGVLQAKKNRTVAEETVRQFEQHLEQAKGFYEVGTKPKFDVTKAEVDLGNAKLNLIKSDNAVRLAIVNLNNAMGLTDAPEYAVEDNLSFVRYVISLDGALSRAYENRPDMKSVAARRKAAEQSVELATKAYFPVVAGNAAYNWSGEKISDMQDGWNIGASVSFPLFSGFLTKHQVSEAKSNLEVLRANEEFQKQTVFLDVQQAFLNLKQAEDSVPVAELTVKQATENLDIANGRYAAGVGSPIEVTDAQVAYANARTAFIQALSDYKVAQASLEKAMGVR